MNQTASEWTAGVIRGELETRGLSARSLGAAVGWSVGTTHRRIKGQLPLTVDEVEAVASFLQLPPAALIRPAGPA